MAQSNGIQSGPPYVPRIAGVGGRPKLRVDVPIDAIILSIYLTGAIANMSIYQINRRKGHKFLMSVAMFGFCMSRVVTMVLRIVWAMRQSNASLAIAAQIFTGVGVLIVYIVLLLLALRVFRATHPILCWNKNLDKSFTGLYMLLFGAFILVITFTILSFYTLNTTLRTVALWIQRAAILYILIFNRISTVLLLLSMLLPHSPHSENFGTGSMRSKFMILGVALFFALFIPAFRCGTAWKPARPASDPAWYDSKAVFYVVLFSFEIVIVCLLLFTRFDRRFWNGSKKSGRLFALRIGGRKLRHLDILRWEVSRGMTEVLGSSYKNYDAISMGSDHPKWTSHVTDLRSERPRGLAPLSYILPAKRADRIYGLSQARPEGIIAKSQGFRRGRLYELRRLQDRDWLD